VAAVDCPAIMIALHPNEARMNLSRTLADPRAKFAQVRGGTLTFALASAWLVSPFHLACAKGRIGCSSSPDT
jgi:hypothetical protein